MKKTIIYSFVLFTIACKTLHNTTTISNTPQANFIHDSTKNLLGHCSVQMLQQLPYSNWFTSNYNSYLPDSNIINTLQLLTKKVAVEIFLGTWCGDSKREVPRMYKVLQAAGIDSSKIKLIMVSNLATAYKQSPQHEEANKYIFRVPTCIIYKNNKPIGTIIESPVESIEADLLKILNHKKYTPNYGAAFTTIQWLKLPESHQQAEQPILIQRLQTMQKNVFDINSLAYLSITQKNYSKAIQALHINEILFPANPTVTEYLLTCYHALHNQEQTINYAKKLLALEPNNTVAKNLLTAYNK